MRPEGIAAASRETKRAYRAYRRILTARSFEAADDAWVDFLNHAGKVYAKLKAACYGHPLDFGWYGKQLDERAKDPLLLYIHMARNCDTHRLEGITAHIPKRGKNEKHLLALPVTDIHGTIYDPPTRYRKIEFGYPDVAIIANLATVHLYNLVEEAASRLR